MPDKKHRFEGVSLKEDDDGWYVSTHRCRSKSYPTPDDIPEGRIKFIRSTGSRLSYPVIPVTASWWHEEDHERDEGGKFTNSRNTEFKQVGKGHYESTSEPSQEDTDAAFTRHVYQDPNDKKWRASLSDDVCGKSFFPANQKEFDSAEDAANDHEGMNEAMYDMFTHRTDMHDASGNCVYDEFGGPVEDQVDDSQDTGFGRPDDHSYKNDEIERTYRPEPNMRTDKKKNDNFDASTLPYNFHEDRRRNREIEVPPRPDDDTEGKNFFEKAWQRHKNRKDFSDWLDRSESDRSDYSDKEKQMRDYQDSIKKNKDRPTTPVHAGVIVSAWDDLHRHRFADTHEHYKNEFSTSHGVKYKKEKDGSYSSSDDYAGIRSTHRLVQDKDSGRWKRSIRDDDCGKNFFPNKNREFASPQEAAEDGDYSDYERLDAHHALHNESGQCTYDEAGSPLGQQIQDAIDAGQTSEDNNHLKYNRFWAGHKDFDKQGPGSFTDDKDIRAETDDPDDPSSQRGEGKSYYDWARERDKKWEKVDKQNEKARQKDEKDIHKQWVKENPEEAKKDKKHWWSHANVSSPVVPVSRRRTADAKQFPKSDFNDNNSSGETCSRWNCNKPATQYRTTGQGKMNACAEHAAEMKKDSRYSYPVIPV